MKLLSILLLLAFPVYAGDPHHDEHPINVPDNGSNHNAIEIGLIIAGTACLAKDIYDYFTKNRWRWNCLAKDENVVDNSGRLTPEIPKNEYTYTIKP